MRLNIFITTIALSLLSFSGDFETFQVLDFKEFESRLYQDNDTTYIINFWATWCVPCRKELPDFERIGAEYQDNKVKVLLVNLDFPDNLDKTLIPFVQQNNIQSEIVVLDDPDSNFWINRIDSSWNGNIPATLIYNDHYREFFTGMMKYELLDSILKQNIY